jgi:hypothetical protein
VSNEIPRPAGENAGLRNDADSSSSSSLQIEPLPEDPGENTLDAKTNLDEGPRVASNLYIAFSTGVSDVRTTAAQHHPAQGPLSFGRVPWIAFCLAVAQPGAALADA